MDDAENTEALSGHTDANTEIDATDVGTEMASPKALATGRASDPAMREARPSASSMPLQRSHGSNPSTAAKALDKSDLRRNNMFHVFGLLAPIGAVALSILIGGDPDARFAFWVGAAVLALCNAGLLYLTSTPARYNATAVGVLWVISTMGVQPAIYYFGPFSAVVMVDMLGIVFIAMGRVRWTALATAIICVAGHLAIALPIVIGVIDDRGVLPSAATGTPDSQPRLAVRTPTSQKSESCPPLGGRRNRDGGSGSSSSLRPSRLTVVSNIILIVSAYTPTPRPRTPNVGS